MKGCSFIHSFILETYIAPVEETTTQRRSQPSHGQKRRTTYLTNRDVNARLRTDLNDNTRTPLKSLRKNGQRNK